MPGGNQPVEYRPARPARSDESGRSSSSTRQPAPSTPAPKSSSSAALRAGRTAFVIAHRLSTIQDADTIVVMDNGAIAEQGTHDQLIRAGGPYARLYAAQFTEAPAATT
jgi:hypothetical protein